MKNREFLTLARFASAEKAQIVKSMLDSMGVECQVVNDIAADILPMLKGDIKIIVNAADYERAKKILHAKFDAEVLKTEWMEE